VPVLLVVHMAAPALVGVVAPERADDGVRLSVLTQNLWYEHPDPAGALEEVLSRGAQVVVLTEFTPAAAEALDGPRLAALRRDYPHRWLEPRPLGGGLAVLSALPFATELRVPLVEPAVVLGVQAAPGVVVDVYGLHPVAPSDRWGLRNWQHDYRVLTDEVAAAAPRTVVAGDLNATTGHRAFRRMLREGRLRDALDVGGGGLAATWPAQGTIPPIMRLDHVLVGRGIAVERVEVLERIGSDHLGVEAWLRVPGT
jgi:endonuclease/exonuclease/phosphatase (EEP) superfamily protein YafD